MAKKLRRDLRTGCAVLADGSVGAGAIGAASVDGRVPRSRGPPDALADDATRAKDSLLPARAVWERYGVTSMTLYRWLADAALAFPAPVYIGRFRYFRLSELLEWESARPRKGQQFGAAKALAREAEAA